MDGPGKRKTVPPVGSRRSGGRIILILLTLTIIATALFLTKFSEPKEGGLEDVLENKSDANATKNGTGPRDEYHDARLAMVRNQIQARNVTDPDVLEAMKKVPRHEFVPTNQKPEAYKDHPLPIGHGQTISQPYIVAVMTESLEIEAGKSRALEVGTGSGYQAAVLGELCEEVYSLEIVAPLAARSSSTLRELGYDNVHVENADGYFGWDEHGPYDVIIITCAASHIPPPLIKQLADGGRLILPLGSPHSWQTLSILEKRGNETTVRYLFPVVFVPMTGEIEKG